MRAHTHAHCFVTSRYVNSRSNSIASSITPGVYFLFFFCSCFCFRHQLVFFGVFSFFFVLFFVCKRSKLSFHWNNRIKAPDVFYLLFVSEQLHWTTRCWQKYEKVEKFSKCTLPFVIKTFCSLSIYLSHLYVHSLSVRSYLFSVSFILSFFPSFIEKKSLAFTFSFFRSFTNCFYFCAVCVFIQTKNTNHSVWMGTSYSSQ